MFPFSAARRDLSAGTMMFATLSYSAPLLVDPAQGVLGK
jgi:hypothetical protein